MKEITEDIMRKLFDQLVQLNNAINNFSFSNGPENRYLELKTEYMPGSTTYMRPAKKQAVEYAIIRRIITDVLDDLGIRQSNSGYSYMIDAVRVIIAQQTIDVRLCNDVYPYVAKMNDIKKYSIIEHNIRNAIASAYKSYVKDNTANNMGVFEGRKPTNKIVLLYITEIVVLRMTEYKNC